MVAAKIDPVAYNRLGWDREVDKGNPWTIPVSAAEVVAARQGNWHLVLTPTRPVPRTWYPPDLCGVDVLCLASGGGQQGPILAAAGANVTVFDNSARQLEQDRKVAEREGLDLRTLQGDMRDLSALPDASFDLIFHPVSNVFCPQIRPVWQEAYRVLRPGGCLLAGFTNPVIYIFDLDRIEEQGLLEVRHKLPYSDLDSLTPEELNDHLEADYLLEFSHTLEDQIGGQIEAGFVIAGFYEDAYAPETGDIPSQYFPTFIATRAIKLKRDG